MRKRGGQSIADLGDFKFFIPSARYELQIFREYLRLHGRSFDHNVKFKQIDNIFLVETPRLESYFIFGLIAPLRQGSTSFQHIVLQTMENDASNIEIKATEEELREMKLPLNGRVSESTREILGKLLKCITKKNIVLPCEEFQSDNGKHCIQCTYKQSMGFLWMMKKSFVYGPRPTVHVPYAHILGLGGEYNAGVEGGEGTDAEDEDSDWEPSSPDQKKRKKR